MADTKQSTLSFFVPGIMGSTLLRTGIGNYGQPIDDEVWGKDMHKNISYLGTNAAVLAASDIVPGEVLSEVVVRPCLTEVVYGDLLDFCIDDKGLALKDKDNFYTFPYDWRADNRETAQKLASFIRYVDPNKDSSIRIIAHSMGGIVSRLMLLSETDIAERTSLLVQIASPIKGSANSYYSLKERPVFNHLLDLLLIRIPQSVRPTRRATLLSVLQGFPSIYQLLPPPEMMTIHNQMGDQYPALDINMWPTHLRDHVAAAIDVHQELAKPLISTVKCVYSNKYKTDMSYVVDGQGNIISKGQRVAGDGSVSCSSAIAYTNPAERYLNEGSNSKHIKLCSSDTLFTLLKEEF